MNPSERDLLATCPPEFKEKWRAKAQLVEYRVKPDGTRGGVNRAAIRLKCLECCCWQQAEVRRCQIRDCALWGLGGQG